MQIGLSKIRVHNKQGAGSCCALSPKCVHAANDTHLLQGKACLVCCHTCQLLHQLAACCSPHQEMTRCTALRHICPVHKASLRHNHGQVHIAPERQVHTMSVTKMPNDTTSCQCCSLTRFTVLLKDFCRCCQMHAVTML